MLEIFNGILFGLMFIFSLGPAFFALIQTSIQKGFRFAFFLAIGIILSDIIYVSFVLLGISSFIEEKNTRFWFGLIGAILLISFGVFSILQKSKSIRENYINYDEVGNFFYFKFILKGFFLNGFNPVIILFWVGIVSAISSRFQYNLKEQYLFFTGTIITIFVTDILKAFIANRLKKMVNNRFILRMNKIVGVVLLIFGCRILYFLIVEF